jgi:ABC-type Fe3+-siderophore transport system permease subunit
VAPGEIPVGVITSILGGSMLIGLLFFRRHSMGL